MVRRGTLRPECAIGCQGAGALAAAGCTYQAVTTTWKRWNEQTTRDPFWYMFLSGTMLVAWTAAFCLGETNWWNNVVPYLELQTLDVRFDVDPATTVGQQLMDVGRVTFQKGTQLDLKQSIGFKNGDQYCVAPIVSSAGGKPESYDFWAIGLNCCSGGTADFHCGEYLNPKARAGLRIMREDQRAFYRLAVQQAEASYNIHANHPLFFYWMEDPQAELESYKDDAQQSFYLGSLAFSALQVVLVVLGVVLHSKM
mmetsp:Transcript_124625/g.399064  ORF Transcript_124625/g.399064 Transcript_124625/m.399064 type:complete len:254 (+) Transcript_124625:1142-1903(+)